ncbi:MAG: FAD-binding oxidoreductase [Flavobacteriaceae bacterium]|nr:FAD-binding oxidoreductase [Flavobacteriaceae bacterium]
MKVDYIIVGLGLAGIAFTEQLIANNKSFVVFNDNSQKSSLVAGGVYNPVILKRFTPVWNATQQLAVAMPFYENLEQKFNTTFDRKFLTKKVFKSIEDQNNWFSAIDKYNIARYLDDKLDYNKYQGVIANYALGNVNETGRVDTLNLVNSYEEFILKNNLLKQETFNYESLEIKDNLLKYNTVEAYKIVFSEGFGLKKNPYFNQLPLTGVKGETITIYAPELAIDFQLKSTVFVLPLGNHYFKVGATFNWTDKTSTPTEEGKKELEEKLTKVINVNYTISEHTAGVRPTTKDRRPLVGKHSKYKNLYVLNGLGTRGVMIAPTVAKALFEFIEFNKELDKEININRFVD